MPRYANPYPNGPYPTDPTFGIAAESIARALFGDPQARAEQQREQAEMERIKAATGYDVSRTRGVDIQNNASAGLPAILAQLVAPQQAPQQSPIGDISTLAEIATGTQPMPTATPAVPFDGINVDGKVPVNYDEQLRAILPSLIGAMGQMQGDKVDTSEVVGTLASMFGTDGIARRGMVAQGKTPEKDFALDMDRADEIAAAGYDADYKTKTGVATINNASDIPVANIRAGATVDAARIAGSSRENVAGINNVGKADVARIKEGGSPVADGRAAALSVYPGLEITQNVRDPNSKLGRANPGSAHNNTKAAIDSRKIPGMTFEQYVQGYRDAGYTILEAKDEYKNPSKHATGPHWHVVLGEKKGGKAGSKAKVYAVNGPIQKSLNEGVNNFINDMGFGKMSPRNKRRIIALATTNYQKTGNLADALVRAEDALRKGYETNKAASKKTAGWGPIKVVK